MCFVHHHAVGVGIELVLLEHTHPPLARLVTGGCLHVASGVNLANDVVVGTGGIDAITSALTSTGMI